MKKKTDRRTFLKLMGTPALMAGAFPENIRRALEIPAHRRTGTIADVKHIVVLMQENRSFDHYFGAMRGVRGFADPHPVTLPSGKSVWHQPNGSSELLPFRPSDNVGMQFLPDPPHGWRDTHAAWNEGRHDLWVPNKGVTTMTYNTREDIPYHYALADAFTLCDAYHCSLLGPTDPNRYHLWTGWVGNDGKAGGPVVTNAEAGYDWMTFPERLEQAGISWKIYQDQGVGLTQDGFWGWTDNAFIGNYGDNSLLYFHQYQLAQPGNPLADRAKTGTNIDAHNADPTKLVEIFRDDVRRGRLPQISWIVAPEAYTEHPNWRSNYGAWYISQFMDVLVQHPEVWSETVLLINYDEEGGFFDHMVPPTPPQSTAQGRSTVETTNEIFPGAPGLPTGPYGFGMRVPMIAISPWSKGGWVNSQLFDHTSVIRFIEERFAKECPELRETNITPWRRAVAGDLTTAFDFRKPEEWRKLALPSTKAYKPTDLTRQPDEEPVPPAHQRVPRQERGVRPARALPYALHARGVVDPSDGSYQIEFRNVGHATGVFQVRSANSSDAPRTYTVEPRKKILDAWPVAAAGLSEYDLIVHGPNGFLRVFKGAVSGSRRARVEVQATYDSRDNEITLQLLNEGTRTVHINIRNNYTDKAVGMRLDRQQTDSKKWSLNKTYGWYDFVITVDEDEGFETRLAGHLETGGDSFSDPIMGGLV